MKANNMPWITACKRTIATLKQFLPSLGNVVPLEEASTDYISNNVLMQRLTTTAGRNQSETHLTYKSVQLPSEPPLVDASVQLKQHGDGPHREDTLKETLQSQHQNIK